MQASNNHGQAGLEPMLRKLEYRLELDEGDRAALLALPHSVEEVDQHQYLVREHDRPDAACLMLRGHSIRHRMSARGSRQILSIHLRGEIVDLHNMMLCRADHSVQMLTPGRIARIQRPDIERIAFEHPRIGKALWMETLIDGAILREWLVSLGRRDARARIAHLLCEFALRLQVAGLGEQGFYELPMTQEQIADATGLTPVHVNRTLKDIERSGLIERIGPRSILIGNWKRLAAAGDFDSNYLHLRTDEPALR